MNNDVDLKSWRVKNGFVGSRKRLPIYYTDRAFAKTVLLVTVHPDEVGWNMDIRPYKDGYKVYDIYVYPQKVSPAYVSVDVARWGLWKASLPDDVEENLNGNGHSHVNMSTFASGVDEHQQHDEILTKKKGFYLFQIWNKRNEINSFFYDIDNKIYYAENDIDIIIEETEGFIAESFKMATPRKDWKNKLEAGEGFESE